MELHLPGNLQSEKIEQFKYVIQSAHQVCIPNIELDRMGRRSDAFSNRPIFLLFPSYSEVGNVDRYPLSNVWPIQVRGPSLHMDSP